MGKIFFVIIGFLLLLRINSSKKGLFAPTSFLIFIYLTSTVSCSLDILINDHKDVLQDKYWPAAMVFLLLLTGFLIPFMKVNEMKWNQIKLPPKNVLLKFAYVIIGLSLYSIIFFITDVVTVFTSGDLARMREQLTGLNGEYTNSGIWNTIASVGASFYDIALLLFFIFYIIGGNRKLTVLLFISSFSYTVQVLSFVGRDGFVFWLFSFVFDYLLFRSFILERAKKRIKKMFLIVGIVMSIPFLAITVSRFGDTQTGTGGGIVSYMGQPLYHWCLYYGMTHRYTSPGAGWPLYYEITGQKQPEGAGLWEADGTNSWVFGTFLKSWYNSIGMTGILCILVFMWIVFYLVFNRTKRRLCFHSLFIYILFFEILAEGVFYFLQYTRGGNLTIVLMFVFFFTFKFLENDKNAIIIKKAQ